MLKWFVTFAFVLLLTHCGKPAPVVDDIDIPPSNTAPSNVIPSGNSEAGTTIPNVQTVQEQGTKVFNAPLVLLRGEIPQHQTKMTASPGI